MRFLAARGKTFKQALFQDLFDYAVYMLRFETTGQVILNYVGSNRELMEWTGQFSLEDKLLRWPLVQRAINRAVKKDDPTQAPVLTQAKYDAFSRSTQRVVLRCSVQASGSGVWPSLPMQTTSAAAAFRFAA